MPERLREHCAEQLQSKQEQAAQLTAFLGLDGFVDEIIHVVDKRESADSYRRIPTISLFAERLAAAAGKSTNIELVTKVTKLGGNGPIMADALAHLGVQTTYLGNLGYPALHPVFNEFAERAEVWSIGEACHTDALEFADGKLMLGKTIYLNDITWTHIQERFGRERFAGKFASSQLVAFVNWTMIPAMSDIWEALLEELCPRLSGRRGYIFFDLADPEKRSNEDIARALELIVRFQSYLDVILGLNLKEAGEIAGVLGLKGETGSPEELSGLALAISAALPIHTLAVHPVTYALAVTEKHVDLVQGPFIAKPVITTGAGDHFNAGFCLGKLLGFDNQLSLLTAVSASGFYVRSGRSPAIRDLVDLLQNWPG